jgi:hypothetical protein
MAKKKSWFDTEEPAEVVDSVESSLEANSEYDIVQEPELLAEVEQSFQEPEQPCDCDLSDAEIAAIKRLLGSPTEPESGYDYEKFARLKLAVIVPEGVMRGSGWKEFVNGVKKYLEPRCPSCK